MRFLLVFCLLAIFFNVNAQTTSWRGTTSSAWGLAANWTAGVPSATVDAVLGDANFTGPNQPSITATANARTLTIGGVQPTNLTVNAALTVASDVLITTLGTLTHTGNTMTVRGNWTISGGAYTPTVATATVAMGGTTQSINNTTTFSRLTINTGSTTSLAASIAITNAFSVTGTFDPVSATNVVTLTGATFTVNVLGRIRVFAATFAGNYTVDPTLNARSIVEYASTTINQAVAAYGYGVLTITGNTTKTLVGNAVLQSSSGAGGNVNVNGGILDLGTFTLNRNAAGGVFTVSNGAELRIGGTNAFPANYTTTTLGASSTVMYNGDDQAVTSKTYGNLILTGGTGAVVKTLPATAMTVAGSLTSTVGTATSVTFNANAAVTVTGNVSIGASTTFNGGTFTHFISGSWANAGTFNGGNTTGTIRFNGAAGVISGAGVQNFNNLTIAGAGVTCTANTMTLAGNLATTGSGTFSQTAGTMVFTGTTKTIGGLGISLFDVDIQGTVSTTATFTIAGNYTASGTFNATSGIITFSGATVSISGAGTTTFAALVVDGALGTASNFSMRGNLTGPGTLTATAGTITFIGTTITSGTHNLFNVVVNGTRLQLGASSTLGIAGALTLTAGTFNTTLTIPNTVVYNGAGAQNIFTAIYYNLILSNSGTKTALGAIQPRGDFTIDTGVTFSAATFTHTVSGNWINNGTFTQGTSNITFNGTTNTTISGTNTFNTLVINKGTAATTVTLNNSASTTTLTMTAGQLLTGANSITITGTRTGNGIVMGTITRTHAFAQGTSYAFESPSNTINFTTITGGTVTSVTVTVTSGPVLDFPSLNSINREYNVSVTNTGTYVATARLHYEDTELNGAVEANLNLWKFVTGTWTSFGKTSSDATSNWVQRTGLTDVVGRWTFYDGAVTHTWLGTANSSWLNAANWKAGIVPQSIDNIQIGTETFNAQPAITTAVSIKSLVLGSVKAVNLSIGAAIGSLTVNGNVTGDWLADQTHTIAVGARNLTIGGDLALSNGNAARRINLTLSTGQVVVTGELSQPGAGSIVFSGNGSLSIGTDYTYSTGGTFTASTGTVIYNGAGNQVMAGGITYNNLTVSKSAGTATLNTATTINGSLTVTGGDVTLNVPVTVAGDVTTSSGTTINENAATLNVGGNWNLAGNFNAPSGGVFFDGTGSQSITQTTFNDVTINKASGTATLANNVTVNGDLLVTAGTLDLATFTMNRATTGGEFAVSDGATLALGGSSNFPTNYTIQTLGSNSTVNYNGASQNITPTVYGNLTVSNTGTKTFSVSTPTDVMNLTISATAALPATATLRIGGNLVNNGAFNISAGSVMEFNGNATQTISGTTTTDFQDITVSNSASPGVSIESNQRLRGVLTLGANATVDADGSADATALNLMSSGDNPTNDASIAPLPTNAEVIGTVSVQRFMSLEGKNNGNIYRYISSPVQNATVADLQNELPVTGTFTGASVCSGCGTSQSMFDYDESVLTGGINGGYVNFPTSINTETFQPGRGYTVFVRPAHFGAVYNLRGTINSGPLALPVSFTSSGVFADDGWNLIGNPYPSTIDWNAISGWTKTNIDGTIYTRDNGGVTGQYATWNGVVGTNGGTQYIASGQGFWVKASGTSPSLSIDETVKVAGTQTTFFRDASLSNMLRVTMSQGSIRDEAVIHFRPDASNTFDDSADAVKLPNETFNFSSQLNGQNKMAINSLDFSSCTMAVPLAMDNATLGSYVLSFANVNSFTYTTSVSLVDKFTNTTIDPRVTPSYPFSITSDAASLDSARFVLHFTMEPAPMDYALIAPTICTGSDAQIELAQTSELVNYQVTVNGTEVFLGTGSGDSEFITVPAALLADGNNSVRVAAVPFYSCGVSSEKTTTISTDKIVDPTTVPAENICREGTTTLAASGATVGQKYNWYASEEDSVALATGANYVTPTIMKSRTYFVSIVNSTGCEGQRIPVEAKVVNFDHPVINVLDDQLTVDYPGDKKWYFNGVVMPNETSSSITPKENGVYRVTIPVESCLAEATYTYTNAVTGVGENLSALSVYPNPVSGYLYFNEADLEIENVLLHNLSGQVIGRFALTKQGGRTTGKYNMEPLPAGMYLLVVEKPGGKSRMKVVKE